MCQVPDPNLAVCIITFLWLASCAYLEVSDVLLVADCLFTFRSKLALKHHLVEGVHYKTIDFRVGGPTASLRTRHVCSILEADFAI